jgi:hypothetical protein
MRKWVPPLKIMWSLIIAKNERAFLDKPKDLIVSVKINAGTLYP